MRVSNLLTTKGRDVATISNDATVADALQLLRRLKIGTLVVTSSNAPLAGIFSERDVVRALADRGADALQIGVTDLMSRDVTTCRESTTVEELMGLMTERRIRHVPVMESGQLVGMVSIGDVVKARFDELEHEKKDLLDYVSSW